MFRSWKVVLCPACAKKGKEGYARRHKTVYICDDCGEIFTEDDLIPEKKCKQVK